MCDVASRCSPNIRWYTATMLAAAAGMAGIGLAGATVVAETDPIQQRGQPHRRRLIQAAWNLYRESSVVTQTDWNQEQRCTFGYSS